MSARTGPALRQLARSTAVLVENNPSQHRGSIGDLAFSANTGRARFNHRAAFVVSSEADALKRIDSFISGSADQRVFSGQVKEQSNPVIGFLFTGQGAQYVKMGRELFETQPEFRRTLEGCDEILRPVLKEPLLKVIYPIEGAASPIDNTEYAQPALFALEYALAQLWKSWGISPSVVMGHSIGEYVAACMAGVFSLEDGLTLVAERGRLMQSLDEAGGMASVFAPADRVIPFIHRYEIELSIAAINSPEQTVISGTARALEKAAADLKAAGIDSRPLAVSHAFHSPLMQPILNEFYEAAQRIEYRQAQIGVISNITGAVSITEAASADYWRRHVLSPVDFAGGMKTLESNGCDVLIEIGPKPTLLSIGKKCISSEGKLWLPSLRMGRSDWLTLLESLAQAFVRGVNVDWAGFDRDYKRRRINLPAYPFQRRRCWFETGPSAPKAEHSLLGRRLPQLAHLSDTHAWEVELNGRTHPYLHGHQVFGNSILPYAIYVEMALEAVRDALGAASNQILDLEMHHPVLIRDDESATLQLVLSREADQLLHFRAYNRAARSQTKNNGSDRGWVLCASAKIQAN
jgi:acyl transferase domain-containing protein